MEKALKDLGCDDKELSILFTGDDMIARMNDRYLKRKGPTNVIAFPMSGGPGPEIETAMMGDVVISVDTALKESKEAGESLEDSIDRLLIHGILHLLGYDHEISAAETARMENEEKRLLKIIREN